MFRVKVSIGYVLFLFARVYSYFIRQYQKSLFSKIGKDVYIGKNCIFTYSTIVVGSDVYIGSNACFQ